MCFWFGLEILRLVYKKCVFWNIERFLSYLTFYPSKKTAPPLIRVEKKFLQNWPCRVSKEAEFCADFKIVQKYRVWQKGKKFWQKKWIFWDFCKKSFFWEKIFGNFLTQEFYTFLNSAQNSASFNTLHTQFRRNFFSTLIRDGAVFSKDKSSNKIETVQYFKNAFL